MELARQISARTRTLTLAIAGVVILLILVYIGWYNYQTLAKLDAEISDLNSKINTHQSYAPMTKQLFDRMRVKTVRLLPLPARGKLTAEQKDRISVLFKDMAQKTKMELVSVSPDVNLLTSGSRSMLVHATLKGDLFQFRAFLVDLGDQAFLDKVEEIEIVQQAGTKEYRLKVWLAVG